MYASHHVLDRLVKPDGLGARGLRPTVAPDVLSDALSLPGHSPDRTVAAEVSRRTDGFDFSNVRIHADARAAQAAERVGAHAFTLGSDIVFGPGEYRPASDSGRRLLAHELAHVVQQHDRPADMTSELTLSHPSDPAEREVDRIVSGATDVHLTPAPMRYLQCQRKPPAAPVIDSSMRMTSKFVNSFSFPVEWVKERVRLGVAVAN
jgi:hypothetical protein